MTEASHPDHQVALLKAFNIPRDGRMSAQTLKAKLSSKAFAITDPAEADQALADLIAQGLITVVGGAKEGHHPRPKASYRLTDKGKHHNRPTRPDHVSDELLEYQGAFILLQVFRAKEQKLTRSDLNGKLKTVAAVGQLEFDAKAAPETVDYHLAELVEKGHLVEQKKGNSVGYTLDPDRGLAALTTARQHQAVSFTLSGQTLNDLLAAARSSNPTSSPAVESPAAIERDEPAPATKTHPLQPDDIFKYISDLQREKYAGKDLIPIHEVRRLVIDHHDAEAGGHPSFDPLVKEMRSNGQLRLIAISDNRDATQEQLNNSIPGMNETLFYIVIQ